MTGTDRMHFLLGGHDLEMLTVRDLLVREGIPFSDLHLRWDNAFLSSYAQVLGELPSDCMVYGIELQEDIVLPANYRRIDHHNQCSHLPSVLEQVVGLLQIPMDRHMQLVAANDRAYIPGLVAMGATKEEIDEIRLADRRAQGVTEEEERLAEKAIAENLSHTGRVITVKALCPRFSPICDRLYPYTALLVYTGNEWMYYGEGAKSVREMFAAELHQGKLFYGGDDNGYIGIKQECCSAAEITEMIERIKNSKNGE